MRAAGAIGVVIAAAVVIERLKALNSVDAFRKKTVAGPIENEAVESRVSEAYCLSCKNRRPIEDPQVLIMRNGRAGVKGLCPVCRKALFAAGRKAA